MKLIVENTKKTFNKTCGFFHWSLKILRDNALPLGALTIVTFLLFSSIFLNPGFPDDKKLYDTQVHGYRIWFAKESLIKGIVPTWSSDWYGGFPFLEMYPPLSQILFSPLALLFPPIFATKAALFLTHLITVLFFYFLSLKIFGRKKYALLASLLMAFFPYRLHESLPRGALAESTAFMFVPLALLLYKMFKEKQQHKYLNGLALIVGFITMSHYIVGMLAVATLLLFVAWDLISERKTNILSILPFLAIGILVASYFLALAFQLSEETNVSVIRKAESSPQYHPIQLFDLIKRAYENPSYVGIISLLLIFSTFFFKSNSSINRYLFSSLLLLAVGLFLYPLIPRFILDNIQFGFRFMTIISVLFSVTIFQGIINVAAAIGKEIDHQTSSARAAVETILVAGIVLVVLVDYSVAIPSGDVLKVPDGVYKFYEKISSAKEFFRVEDQAFFTYGFSPTLHHHASTNGGFYQIAPKYYFVFWSLSWRLLEHPIGRENFASLHGAFSTKYFFFSGKLSTAIPYLKEAECGNDYCIYLNERFLPQIRLVPFARAVSSPEPEYINEFMNMLTMEQVDFSRTAFVHSPNSMGNVNASVGSVKILEASPGYYRLRLSGISNPQFLVVGESPYPGWSAKMNDRELRIIKGIPFSLVIPVEENGIVELKYLIRTNPEWLGSITALVSLLAFSVLLIGFFVYRE